MTTQTSQPTTPSNLTRIPSLMTFLKLVTISSGQFRHSRCIPSIEFSGVMFQLTNGFVLPDFRSLN